MNTIYKIKTIKLEYKINDHKASKKITTPAMASDLLCQIFRELDVDQEHFCVLALNSDNRITGYKILASGGQASTIADPKILFRNALLLGAVGIILAHNHPSGCAEMSEGDIVLTEQLKKCGEMLGIEILDHIVIAGKKFYSWKKGK